jgi:hypothetical protein
VKSKINVIVLALFLVALGGYAGAEEKFGVGIYPGANLDSAATEFLKQISPESAAYRTGDKVEKVIAFYKKQPGLNFVGGDQGGGMLRKGNVDVTVQSPWMDTKTGKMEKDTLISIVKNKE